METCVTLMKESDFGFVHQVLTFKRLRAESLGALSEDLNTLLAGFLHNVVAYGRDFLTDEEFDDRLGFWTGTYYNYLAVSVLRGRRDTRFWKYHRKKLTESGVGFSGARLLAAIGARVMRAVLNPLETLERRSRFTNPSAAGNQQV